MIGMDGGREPKPPSITDRVDPDAAEITRHPERVRCVEDVGVQLRG